ncbi:MAG: hypothetical protein AAF385_01830 [Pseudomonadota bacterium]
MVSSLAQADQANRHSLVALDKTQPRAVAIRYELGFLATALEARIGNSHLTIRMENVLEIYEHKPLSESYLDEGQLLSDVMRGLEADIGEERILVIAFTHRW